ncbi:MAG: PBP1A family penicillin-binding protein [Clostridia bacterium]|nr:PBP1A family penicillin-binding protein [Clostridia bacterium]MDD4376136.1 PBP1A family penicillin-binding protein [Clostridia bacterium]
MPSKKDENKKRNKIKLRRLGTKGKTVKKEIPVNTNKKNTKKKLLRWKIFKIFLFTMLGLGVIGTGVVIGVLTGIIDKTENVDLAQLQSQKLTSFIYDTEEKEIATLYSEENRINISYEKIPKHLIDAVISIEDERFWKHNGVDVKRTGAAIVTYIFNAGKSSFGGSTITQQLIKNSTGDKEADWTRKIREWYRAISLEKKLEKEDILESYLNTIYLGAGASGIEVASHTYFNKSVTEVNLAEAATLAAIIQLPETYNPYRGEEAASKLKRRKETVLAKMLELKKINKEEYEEALKQEIKYEKGKIAMGTTYTYFVDAVIESVATDLMEKQNVSKEMALQMLYGNGYKIYTTQVPSVQKTIDEAFSNKSWFYKDKAGTFMQAGMVVIDNSNGNVAGLSGGAGEKETDRSFNRATQAIRQPGSTFKPISAYGPAFERGISYPGMGIDDSQLTIGNWTPKNYYGYFNGYVSARQAINASMNIPAVRTLQSVGVDYAYEFAKKLGISTLNNNDKSLSFALGGLDKGVTVLDITGAYSVFANNGIYLEPKLYTKVVDSNGKEILSNKESAQRVMKDTAAYLITDCLKTVVTSGTGTSTRLGGGMETAGKTGNTNEDKDQWFAGYSSYYTAVVWNGYDKPKSINRTYPYTSMRVWTDVMKKIHSGLAAKKFTKPTGIVSASVCTHSGKIPTEACKIYGGVIKTEIFASGTVPTDTCSVHKMATICKITGKKANENCPETEEKAYITRDTTPRVKPRDWNRMIITEQCTTHNESNTKIDNGNVNPYN